MIATREIAVGEARLFVHCTGAAVHGATKAPLALLVHGYPLDHRMWLDLMHSSVQKTHTLAAIDLRGHGRSPWAGDATHEMTTFADDLAAVARTISDDPVDLVALSMGGYAALSLCERHPSLVRSLVLVDTKATADTDAGKEARRIAAQNVVQHGRRWLADQMLPKLVAESAPAEVRARLQTMIESTPVETILADLDGMCRREERMHVLAGLRVPVLCAVGALDVLTPVSEAAAMATAAVHGTLEVIGGAGHMVPMERPVEFAAMLARFWFNR